jgi:putative endonuclease
MTYFYILKSEKGNEYYYGSTDDLQRRLPQHKNGFVVSTKHRLPINLVYYEAYQALDSARHRERQVKSSGHARETILKRIDLGH